VLTAIILAGGRSSRMGTPKALLPFGGEPLIVHIVRRLQPLFREIVVVAAPDGRLPSMPVTVVHDDVAYQGPVGGIYYGLKAAAGEFGFVTSCDSAFSNAALVSHLISLRDGYDVVVPRWEDRLQPLLAIYRKTVLPHLEAQLANGDLRPVHLFDKVRTRIVESEEVRRFDPEGRSFFNMNTPADYEEAASQWNAEMGRAAAAVTCVVELFGVAQMLARQREITLTLPAGATFGHVFAALADRIPVLAGRVIGADGRSLIEGYACNVNGIDFVRSATVSVRPGDNIAILSADAGG
jgi:molybdopterin-guanine dinucleotide biosynthesis protein A/molybdopterin converting factor small subunit